MRDAGLAIVGKYRIIDLVGEGAMGIVYRGTDTVLNRTVAIKVMSESVARQKDLRDRFLREAQAAGSLQHPNVVTIYDFGEVEGHLFIAMEYVDGTDLEHLLAAHEPLTLKQRLDIAIDVLTGLSYAHRHGIVHRDVKPANIRVREDGRAKIMDFGIAYLTSSQLTQTGVMMGTPSYMAPEQVVGGNITAATDVFAMGSVLYELLTGARPFEGHTLHNTLYKIVSEQPPPLRDVLPGLPSELEKVVDKALRKEPGERYQDALEMADELAAILSRLDESHRTSATVSLRRSVDLAMAARRKPTARRRLMAGAAAVVLIAGAAGGGMWLGSRSGARPAVDVAGVPLVQRSAGETVPAGASDTAAEAMSSPGDADTPSAAASREASDRDAPTRQDVPASTAPPIAIRDRAGSRTVAPPPPTITRADSPNVDAGGAPARPETVRTMPPIELPRSTVAVTPPVRIGEAVTPVLSDSLLITQVVASYARAIESRDLGSVRRLYPGMTTQQADNFQTFFDATRGLRVTFRISQLTVSGDAADARVAGTYEYETARGRTERQPVSFQAILRRHTEGWRLLTVR